jgi:hypothetical protein
MSSLMSIFNRNKVSKPHRVDTVDNQRHMYGGTRIQVQSQVIAQTGGDYKAIVFQHLDDINSFPIGQQFLHALSQSGKTVLIVYGGPNNNQAAGSIAGYVMLRRYHDQLDRNQFANELQQTLQRAGLSTRQLADQLVNTRLNNWAGGFTPNPLRKPPPVPPKPPSLGGPPPVPPKPPSLGGRPLVPPKPNWLSADFKIRQWLDGSAMPTRDEMDVLMLTLPRDAIQKGPGVGTRINYDPHKTVAGGVPRPPQVALFHELMHAYYNGKGAQLGREDSLDENNGGRLFELMAVGMPPFDSRRFSENKFRTAVGVGLRPRYP